MIASLAMYDHPSLTAAHDALWADIANGLRAAAIEAPEQLCRGRDLWEVWQNPELLLGQTCGLPFRARLKSSLHLVGTFDYGLPDTKAGYYRSVWLVRADDPRRELSAFAGARLAVNDPLSHSGWFVPWSSAIAFAPGPRTGAHAASVQAVSSDAADIAAVDAITWRTLVAAGEAPGNLRVLSHSAQSPGLPLVTALPDLVPLLRRVVARALGTQASRALGITGLVQIPASAYTALPIPPAPPA